MKEQQIQSAILHYLKKNNIYAVKVITASKSGVPDILACLKGRFVGFEIKAPRKVGNVSELQKYNIAKIKSAGGEAFVVTSLDEVQAIVVKLLANSRL